jgi:hypothetical protein
MQPCGGPGRSHLCLAVPAMRGAVGVGAGCVISQLAADVWRPLSIAALSGVRACVRELRDAGGEHVHI